MRSTGFLFLLTQAVEKPNLDAPTISHPLEETNRTSLTLYPILVFTNSYTLPSGLKIPISSTDTMKSQSFSIRVAAHAATSISGVPFDKIDNLTSRP